MPTLSSAVSHDYNPKLVYKHHSENLPHLSSWIDELIHLSERSTPLNTHPTTDHLVESLQRYDAIFKELLRQTSIFSDPVTRMLAKTWAGVFKLMDYMIKSYHRYVKHTSHLQTQAQNLLLERQGQAAAEKVHHEEFELERAALRARIRNLESEMEAMNISKRYVEKENAKMRRLVEVYINSRDMNDPVWDLLNEDDASSGRGSSLSSASTIGGLGHDLLHDDGAVLGFTRKELYDPGVVQLRILNRLDVEINEVISGVMKEENRQRLLMQDITRLIEKNNGLFEELDIIEKAANAASNIRSKSGSISFSTRVSTNAGDQTEPRGLVRSSTLRKLGFLQHKEAISVGIQVDSKDEFSLVDGVEQPRLYGADKLGPAPLAPVHARTPGDKFPYALRRTMTTFPEVQRVPPAVWACQRILAVYFAKMSADDERTSKGMAKLSLPHYLYQYFLESSGLPSAADCLVAQLLKACEAHMNTLPRVGLFVSQLGLIDKDSLPPLDVRDTDFVLSVLQSFVDQGELVDRSLTLKRKVVAKSLTVVKPDVSRIAAVNVVKSLFDRLLPDHGEEYIVKIKSMHHSEKGQKYVDVDKVMDLLMEPWTSVRMHWEDHARYVFHDNCKVYKVLQEAQFADDEGMSASDTILAEVQKASAGDCMRRPLRLFQRGEASEADFAASAAASAGAGAAAVGGGGKDTNGKLAAIHASGNPNKEPVCEAMDKKSFSNALLLIVPDMPLSEIDKVFEQALDIAHDKVLQSLARTWLKCVDTTQHASGSRPATRGGVQSLDEIDEMEEEGEEDADDSADAKLDFGFPQDGKEKTRGARRGKDQDQESVGALSAGTGMGSKKSQIVKPKEFYTNLRNSHTQWTKPYVPKIFRGQDIEIDTFVDIVLREDIFAKSPLLDLMHIPARDLWSNADMFHKQVNEALQREKHVNFEQNRAQLHAHALATAARKPGQLSVSLVAGAEGIEKTDGSVSPAEEGRTSPEPQERSPDRAISSSRDGSRSNRSTGKTR